MSTDGLEILLAYLLGSINGSLVLGRLRGVDIRTQGSGNAGGTNALRTQGRWFALGVIVIDVAKAWLAVRFVPGVASGSRSEWLALACGFAAIVGHVYPIFHGFRGGKGVATLLGTLLAVSPILLCAVLAVWFLMMFAFGYVGLGSIVATASLPVLIFWGADLGYIGESARWPWSVFALACALFVAWTHRSNLARMRAGTEPRARRLWLWGRWRGLRGDPR
jgi:glycerol-3-phosphate acyltransferase PlsY